MTLLPDRNAFESLFAGLVPEGASELERLYLREKCRKAYLKGFRDCATAIRDDIGSLYEQTVMTSTQYDLFFKDSGTPEAGEKAADNQGSGNDQ